LASVGAVFGVAVKRRLMTINPAAEIDRIKLVNDGKFSILEPAEFEAVYSAVMDSDGGDEPDTIHDLNDERRMMFGAILSVAFYTGLRQSELIDLSWRNVDFRRKMIRVESGFAHSERGLPKSGKVRSTPMGTVVAQRLAELRERSGAMKAQWQTGRWT